jgi:hypothetical protein
MSTPRFLLDEHLPHLIADELQRREPTLQALTIGEPDAPRRGTLDPEILVWAEAHGYLLVTNNRRSMPAHLAAYLASGHHVPGILTTSFPLRIGPLIEVLLLVWGASFPDEYQDKITYLPLI